MHMGHNATWAIWMVYVIGQVLHVLLQADASARAKNNSFTGVLSVLKLNAIRIMARTFVCTLLFAYFWSNPNSIKEFLGHIGVTVTGQTEWFLTLPITWPIAGMYGFFSDTALSFIPGLKNALPAVDEDASK